MHHPKIRTACLLKLHKLRESHLSTHSVSMQTKSCFQLMGDTFMRMRFTIHTNTDGISAISSLPAAKTAQQS